MVPRKAALFFGRLRSEDIGFQWGYLKGSRSMVSISVPSLYAIMGTDCSSFTRPLKRKKRYSKKVYFFIWIYKRWTNKKKACENYYFWHLYQIWEGNLWSLCNINGNMFVWQAKGMWFNFILWIYCYFCSQIAVYKLYICII